MKILLTLGALSLGAVPCEATRLFSGEIEPDIDGIIATKQALTPYFGKTISLDGQMHQLTTLSAFSQEEWDALDDNAKVIFRREPCENEDWICTIMRDDGKSYDVLRVRANALTTPTR
ncbi:MAG: hypothetical protein C0514_00105 [Candidatus Puniceispirillum sp.]|nr:hypothetical protein [Candidatus Puniceispirillum sp.]